MHRFAFHRFWAVVVKEMIQMRRDRLTFGMMIGIPLLQLTLFGFAINSDPKHLPTALRLADEGPFARHARRRAEEQPILRCRAHHGLGGRGRAPPAPGDPSSS